MAPNLLLNFFINCARYETQGRNGKQKNRKLLKEDKDEIGSA